MAYTATVLKVLIASPGDVGKERQAISEIFQMWNSLHAQSFSIFLQPVMWEKDTTPELGGRAQSIINDQIVKDCDILVAAFWTRLGTPTGKAKSGTLEEIIEFETANKPILIYFSSQPVSPDSIDTDQYKLVLELKDEMKKKGLFATYDNLYEFREKLLSHLTRLVRNFEKKESSIKSISNTIDISKSVASEQIRIVRENFEIDFISEKKNEPIDIEVGRDLINQLRDKLLSYKKRYISLLSKSQIKTISNALKICNDLVSHQLYLDGGQSYDEFWSKGMNIIKMLNRLYSSILEV
ncbi:MAG: hypothetical protein Q7U64_14415 [Desulfocapsaceae bacterium]|nr:hypothetical protein [Desulfocapsaceae bacterium]